jgi:hypothetical protein
MRTVSEIEAEIEKQEIIKADSERKIAEAQVELTAAQSMKQPMGDDFVTEQIKEFNKARNSGQNPLQQKKGA